MPKYIVRSGDTLTAIAARFGVSLAALEAANPQISDPNRIFPGQVVSIPGSSPASGSDYVVQLGDTLTAIAARFGVSLAALEAANPQISDPNRIFPGQVVSIPGSSPASGSDYVVQLGDTLTAIATRFGVSLAALEAANPQISDPNRIFPGQVVSIPGSSPASGSDYVVQLGDTLTAIAARFGVSLAALEAANPQISDPNRIFPGQIITVTPLITYVRHNIWTLDQIDHWHPTIYGYARGVGVLMDRTNVNPLDPIGWQYQSDVHGTAVNPDQFRNQCQHFTWFFLPWHRMYLEWFERIIRSAIAGLADIDDETKRTWALPYWNYSNDDAARRRLPQAFLDVTLPDGITPNPLRVPGPIPQQRLGVTGGGCRTDKSACAGPVRRSRRIRRWPYGIQPRRGGSGLIAGSARTESTRRCPRRRWRPHGCVQYCSSGSYFLASSREHRSAVGGLARFARPLEHQRGRVADWGDLPFPQRERGAGR